MSTMNASDKGNAFDTTATTVDTETKPGIFARTWLAMSRNPVTTAIVGVAAGAGAAGGAAYALYRNPADLAAAEELAQTGFRAAKTLRDLVG